MQDMVVYLTKLRLQSDKSEKAKQREVRIASRIMIPRDHDALT